MAPKKRVLASLVIPHFNGKEMLSECLSSLKKNTRLAEAEVFVVDGGSTDGSQAMVKKKFPWAGILHNPMRGFGAAINIGFSSAKGKYLVMLNNDIHFLPGWLDELVNAVESNPGAGVAGARMVGKDERPEKYSSLPPIQEKMAVCGACLLTSVDVWRRVGMIDYDSFKPMYGEEVDWCYRARLYGYSVMLCNKSKVIHLGSVTTKSTMGLKKRCFMHNRHAYRAILSSLSLSEITRSVPGQGLVFLESIRQGTAISHAKAFFAALSDLRHTVEMRRKRMGAAERRAPLECDNCM